MSHKHYTCPNLRNPQNPCDCDQPEPLTLTEARQAAMTLASWAKAEYERAEQLAAALADLALKRDGQLVEAWDQGAITGWRAHSGLIPFAANPYRKGEPTT